MHVSNTPPPKPTTPSFSRRDARAVRFLVDAQLPPALARLLAARGYEAEHVADLGMLDASDRQIWQRALERNAAIITKDEDLADMAMLKTAVPVIVWIRIGNTSRSALLEWFEPLIDDLVTAIGGGERILELR